MDMGTVVWGKGGMGLGEVKISMHEELLWNSTSLEAN